VTNAVAGWAEYFHKRRSFLLSSFSDIKTLVLQAGVPWRHSDYVFSIASRWLRIKGVLSGCCRGAVSLGSPELPELPIAKIAELRLANSKLAKQRG
jgi:hypothetical protein